MLSYVHNGFDINQLAAEYRTLRASILRLWGDVLWCRSLNRLNNHRLKPVGWNYGLKVRIRVG